MWERELKHWIAKATLHGSVSWNWCQPELTVLGFNRSLRGSVNWNALTINKQTLTLKSLPARERELKRQRYFLKMIGTVLLPVWDRELKRLRCLMSARCDDRSLHGNMNWNFISHIHNGISQNRSLYGNVNCNPVCSNALLQQYRSLYGSVNWNIYAECPLALQEVRSLRGSVCWNKSIVDFLHNVGICSLFVAYFKIK